jgi:hypothetical protein
VGGGGPEHQQRRGHRGRLEQRQRRRELAERPGGASGSPSAGAGSGSAAAQSIAAGQTAYFGQPGQPQIEFSAAGLKVGDLAKVTFSFGDAGTVTVQAQIQPNTGDFADYNPNPATPSPSASASASASASSSASSSASASASASASPTSSKK